MDKKIIERHFGLLGARVKIGEVSRTWRSGGIDIRKDKIGEYFDIRVNTDEPVGYEVVDVKPDLRHLLLLARTNEGKEKFLCGHDERHWFVCAVPGNGVSGVVKALEALQPATVRGRIAQNLRRHKNRFERRNEAYVRQGEWFFVPAPELVVNPTFVNQIHKNEPLSRGRGSKPHLCEEIFRTGGELVWVSQRHRSGISQKRYAELIKTNPEAASWQWRTLVRNAIVFARGAVRHSDHKTIVLNGWHRVFMNTENEAPGMRHVVFLD
ncbi:MAG TPA: hypothetical protein VNI84_06435 [Pyrinomonadaceae bacterium]|nr:hypothetical protein [Pyrinomonadaceae bacterium]